jgi:hypothetical protein
VDLIPTGGDSRLKMKEEDKQQGHRALNEERNATEERKMNNEAESWGESVTYMRRPSLVTGTPQGEM